MSVSLLPDPNVSFQLATAQDVPNILNLIEKVRANLNDAQQHFLKDKSAEEIATYIDLGFPTVLALKDGQLAGVAISTPQGQGLGASNLPEMFNRGHFMCIGTVAVDPAFQGQRLSKHIVADAFEKSSQYICEQHNQGNTSLRGIIAKVSVANELSQKAFSPNNFNNSGETYTDPQGGYQFYIFNRTAEGLPPVMGVSDNNIGMREQMAAQKRLSGRRFHHG